MIDVSCLAMSGKNYRIVLQARPGVKGQPKDDHFRYEECPYPSETLQANEVIIRTCYLSVDPALRCLMNEDSGVDYVSAWPLGECIAGFGGIGIVVCSTDDNLHTGQLVHGPQYWPWSLYFKTKATEHMGGLVKVPAAVKPPQLLLHTLVGLTALIGLRQRGHIKPSKTCVVSGAAGGVGSLAVQVARLEGCTNVVGICGTDEKCAWITADLGATAAINYKTVANIDEALNTYCPHGVDVYFDNVGGSISEAVIKQMNTGSHVVLCGQISQYNEDVPYPPPISEETLQFITDNNIARERFLVLNYASQFEEVTAEMLQLIAAGKLKVRETVHVGLAKTGEAFVSMMNGGNIGKQIVHVSDTSL